MSGILVLGAGGHGKVVADILQCAGAEVLGFLDDNPATWGSQVLDLPVLGAIETYARYQPAGLVLGIGANRVRRTLVERLGPDAAPLWYNAIHPRSTVARSSRLGRGVVIVAGAVVNPEARLGDHVIINSGATVDHDCVLGSYVHIAPGANLAGGVSVGEESLVGIGAAVIASATIGRWTTVGAGAVVIHNVPDQVIAKGIPASW